MAATRAVSAAPRSAFVTVKDLARGGVGEDVGGRGRAERGLDGLDDVDEDLGAEAEVELLERERLVALLALHRGCEGAAGSL